MFTLTPDRSAIRAVELREVASYQDTLDGQVPFAVTLTMYYHPAIPINNDAFEIVIFPVRGGMAQSDVQISGTLTDAGLAGTATPRSCLWVGQPACTDAHTVTWTATEEAPALDPVLISAHVEGARGHVVVGMDAERTEVRSFTLIEVPLGTCSSSDQPFTGRIRFDPPADPTAFTKQVWLLDRPEDPQSFIYELYISVEGSVTASVEASGTLAWNRVSSASSCLQTVAWTSVAETPTAIATTGRGETATPLLQPTATPPRTLVAPSLPLSGAGPPSHSATQLIALLAALGAMTLSACWALRQRAT